MEITKRPEEGVLHLDVNGRLDGYWADYLDRVLTEAVRDGHHQVRIDCSQLVFLSSAGIAVLMKFHKELSRINGAVQVVNPSKPVSATLRLTRLDVLLIAPVQEAARALTPAVPARHFEQDGAEFDVYTLEATRPMTGRVIGRPVPLSSKGPTVADAVSLAALSPAFVVGVGAFGETVADCQERFGELLSVAGATAYQPADGTNVPDYLVATGALTSSVHALDCLACEGGFSRLLRFDVLEPGTTIGFSRVVKACLTVAEAALAGIVVVAEADGLVGAALRRSPVSVGNDDDFFAHPGIRSRLAFTGEPAFRRSVVLAAGFVASGGAAGEAAHHLRPIGADCAGHVHAAAFQFKPLRKGPIELGPTVSSLFEPDRLQGVLHLVYDDRGPAGAGESLLVRGACWIGPVSSPWTIGRG